jgi:hypothetical protein
MRNRSNALTRTESVTCHGMMIHRWFWLMVKTGNNPCCRCRRVEFSHVGILWAILLVLPGACGEPTASAVMGDLVTAARHRVTGSRGAAASTYTQVLSRPSVLRTTRGAAKARMKCWIRVGALPDCQTGRSLSGANIAHVLAAAEMGGALCL